ncbi:hypothetical protein JXA32_15340 [Candidatus Sumerlaeota bacterium]|nr:hypothetical protein [Candidatus Sumerlaeota bacterium]
MKPETRGNLASRILSGLMLAPLLLLAPAALEVIRFAAQCIQFPYQLDPEEGALLFQSMMLRHGELFYRPLLDYPYIAGTYAPLYHAANALMLLFFDPGFAPGRVMSLAAVIATLLCAAAILWRQTRYPFISLCCPLFYLVSYSMVYWIGFYRVDLTAIALNAAGLAALFAAQERRNWHAWLAGAMFLLAGYTKQSQLAAPLAAMIYLLCTDRKSAWRVAAVWIGGGVLIFAALNVITRGQFYIHTVRFNANEFEWRQLPGNLRHLRNFNLWFALGGAWSVVYLIYAAIRDRMFANETDVALAVQDPPDMLDPRKGDSLFFVLYAALCMLYIVGLAKKGSSYNYVLEPLLSMGLLVGVGAGRMLDERLVHPAERPRKKLWIYSGYAAFIILLALLTLHSWQLTSGGFPRPENRFRKVMFWRERTHLSNGAPLQAGNRALTAVRQVPGEVYSELPIFSILAGRQPHFQPFIMSRLAREGKWDQSGFVRDLRAGRFALLILAEPIETMDPRTGTNLYTAEMAAAMRHTYRRAGADGCPGWFDLYYYTPRSNGVQKSR